MGFLQRNQALKIQMLMGQDPHIMVICFCVCLGKSLYIGKSYDLLVNVNIYQAKRYMSEINMITLYFGHLLVNLN